LWISHREIRGGKVIEELHRGPDPEAVFERLHRLARLRKSQIRVAQFQVQGIPARGRRHLAQALVLPADPLDFVTIDPISPQQHIQGFLVPLPAVLACQEVTLPAIKEAGYRVRLGQVSIVGQRIQDGERPVCFRDSAIDSLSFGVDDRRGEVNPHLITARGHAGRTGPEILVVEPIEIAHIGAGGESNDDQAYGNRSRQARQVRSKGGPAGGVENSTHQAAGKAQRR